MMSETYKSISNRTSERQAQLLLNEPVESIENMFAYEEMLQEDLALMRKRQPRKYHRKFVRHMRKPILSALGTHFYTNLLRDVLPKLQQDTLEISDREKLQSCGRNHNGVTARYTGTLLSLFRPKFDELRKTMENPKDRYHNLWVCHEAAAILVKSADFAISRMPLEYSLSMQGIFEDNANVSLDLLIQQGREAVPLSQLAGRRSSAPLELASEAVRNVDLFTMLAGSNAKLMRQLVHDDPASQHFEKYENATLHSEQDFMPECPQLFIRDGRTMTFNHRSLERQAWPLEGYCPATPILQPPDPDDCQVVESFFSFFENRYGCEINRVRNLEGEGTGAFDRSTILMLLGAYVAEKTVFQAWPDLLPGIYAEPYRGSL